MDIKEPRGTVHCCTGSAGPRGKAQISFAQQRRKRSISLVLHSWLDCSMSIMAHYDPVFHAANHTFATIGMHHGLGD